MDHPCNSPQTTGDSGHNAPHTAASKRGLKMTLVAPIVAIACLLPCAAPFILAGLGALGVAHLGGSLVWGTSVLVALVLLAVGVWRTRAQRVSTKPWPPAC